MIFLKKLISEDLNLILSWKKKNEYLNEEHRLNVIFQKNWFADIEKDTSCKYWVINSGSIKVGIADINHIDNNEKVCNLEFVIEEKYFRNRGIEEIVFFNLLEYAFYEINMEKVYIHELYNSDVNKFSAEISSIGEENESIGSIVECFKQKFICIEKINWEKIKKNYCLRRIDID